MQVCMGVAEALGTAAAAELKCSNVLRSAGSATSPPVSSDISCRTFKYSSTEQVVAMAQPTHNDSQTTAKFAADKTSAPVQIGVFPGGPTAYS